MTFGRSAIVLLVLACGGCNKNDSKPETTTTMNEITIPVDGMACNRCASRVQKTLTALDGVGAADVSLEQKRVVIHFDPHHTTPDKLATAIIGAGFKAGTPSEAPR